MRDALRPRTLLGCLSARASPLALHLDAPHAPG